MTDQKVADWKWNVWEMDRKGKRKKWIGFFLDPKSAFGWIKKQQTPTKYRVNNVPPPWGPSRNPEREVIATSPTAWEMGPELPVKEKGEPKPKKVRPKKPQPVAAAPRRRDNSPEMQKMRREAADIYRQHHADEQAEMESEDAE